MHFPGTAKLYKIEIEEFSFLVPDTRTVTNAVTIEVDVGTDTHFKQHS